MQSNAAKAVLGVVLVAMAVVLFVVLQDGSDGDEPAGQESTAQTDGGGGPSPPEEPQKPTPPPVPEIVVRNGAPVGGVKEIEATSGGRVRFRVSADEDGDVHVHGYDLERPVSAGKPVTIAFPADLEGGYEVELHSHTRGDIPIATLAVNPG